jgi:hypothetical protein
MLTKTKPALSAAIVVSTAFTASAATKHPGTNVSGSAFYTRIPGYYDNGNVVAIPDPDHSGQPL